MNCQFHQNCIGKVEAFCDDCSPNLNLCLDHSSDHTRAQRHFPKIYDSQIIKRNLTKLIKVKSREIEKTIIEETSNFILLLEQNMKNCLRKLRDLRKNTKDLKELDQVLIDKLLFKQLKTKINNLILFKEKTENQGEKQKKLFNFKPNSNELLCFDCETLKYEKKIVQKLAPQAYDTFIYQLSDDKIFAHGGFAKVFLNTTYYINPISCIFRELRAGDARSYSVGEVVQNKIYMFGGFTNKCSCFDIELETWTKIQNLPVYSKFVNAVSINKMILVLGSEDCFISMYNLKKDTYESLNIRINFGNKSALIRNNEEIFLLTNDYTFLANLDDISKWTAVNLSKNTEFSNFSVSKAVIHGNSAYFIIHGNIVIRFDFLNYSVSKVITMI